MSEPRMIYLATAGEFSDYRVKAAFTRREDAEAYALGDDVAELELHDGPLEVRTWHQVSWSSGLPDRVPDGITGANPHEFQTQRDYDGEQERVVCEWSEHPLAPILYVGAWELDRARNAYREQRVQYYTRYLATQGGVSI